MCMVEREKNENRKKKSDREIERKKKKEKKKKRKENIKRWGNKRKRFKKKKRKIVVQRKEVRVRNSVASKEEDRDAVSAEIWLNNVTVSCVCVFYIYNKIMTSYCHFSQIKLHHARGQHS